MGLSFFNARRAKEKEKQKLSASIGSAETLIDAKDETASLAPQEQEGLSLEPQPIEDVVPVQEQTQEPCEETQEVIEETQEPEQVEPQEQEEIETQEEVQAPKEETKKVSDAQKIKNAKQKAKANKTK